MPYHTGATTAWPRILRCIAILTLLYGAAVIGEAVSTALIIWPLRRIPKIPATPGLYWFWAIGCALMVAIGTTLIWGAARLLRSASHHLILVGFWTLIALWPVGTLISLFIQPALGYFNLLMASVLHGTARNLFPFLVILLLRAHRLR